VKRWQASGLSQRQFCKREGIPEWKFSNWKKLVLRAETEHHHFRAAARIQPMFAPVTIVAQEEPETCSTASACAGSEGMKIVMLTLPAGTGASVLREVIEAVLSKC
jgi:hypothetical protein